MEILKHGKYFGKKLVFECHQCGCEFAVSDLGNLDEVDSVWAVSEIDPFSRITSKEYYESRCPECGHTAIGRLIQNKNE